MAKKDHFVLGFILGAGATLAATYLLAPKNTEDFKNKIKDGGNQFGDRAADYFAYAKDATSDLRDSAEEFVTGLKAKLEHNDDIDLDAFDDETEDILSEFDNDEEEDFDDIVVDGKSAFAQAKDDTTTAEAEVAAAVEEPAAAAESEAPTVPAEAEPKTDAE